MHFDYKNYYYDTRTDVCYCFETVNKHMPKEESEQDKLKKKFDELMERLHDKGYISIGFLCGVMGFECDNPYKFYCGDKDKWQKDVIERLHKDSYDPVLTKQLIEVLHEQYKDGEEE